MNFFSWSADRRAYFLIPRPGAPQDSRQMESAHRTKLALGEVGIREKKPAPALKEFLKQEFLPYVETRHASKENTLRYYKDGSAMPTNSELAKLRLDELSDQHAQQFALQHSTLSPSGINRGLRTMRRALNLAFQWNRLDKPVKVTLAKGERQRERVLDDDEIQKYLDACPQPWRDCATIILDEGFRPSEVFALRWTLVFFNEDGTGLIQVAEGKSKAAKRMLPMTPRVYELLWNRYESSGRPSGGWIFPSRSQCGHFKGDAAKDQHKKALTDSGVKLDFGEKRFVPYTLRHTALTNLGEKAGDDVFVLARIAGHSSITITQRYIHPQADAINRVFAAQSRGNATGHNQIKGGHKTGHNRLGHRNWSNQRGKV
jgi:integrase